MPGVRRLPASAARAPRQLVSDPGSVVSPGRLPQNADVQRLLGNQLLQAAVLLFQRLQPLHLVRLNPGVLRSPLVVRRLPDLQVPAYLRHRLTRAQQPFGFAQNPHDLRNRELFLLHSSPPRRVRQCGLPFYLDQFTGGRPWFLCVSASLRETFCWGSYQAVPRRRRVSHPFFAAALRDVLDWLLPP